MNDVSATRRRFSRLLLLFALIPIVLVLAWSLSAVAASLGTADYLVALLGDAVPAALLPTRPPVARRRRPDLLPL